jgi:hypothetical protein
MRQIQIAPKMLEKRIQSFHLLFSRSLNAAGIDCLGKILEDDGTGGCIL